MLGQSSTSNNARYSQDGGNSGRLRHNRPDRRENNQHFKPNSRQSNDDGEQYKSRRPIRQMGFMQIQGLLENEDIEDVIFQLTNDRKGFKAILEAKNLKTDIVVLVLKLLAKICTSSFQTIILETMLRSNFAESILNYISKIPLQVSTYICNLSA